MLLNKVINKKFRNLLFFIIVTSLLILPITQSTAYPDLSDNKDSIFYGFIVDSIAHQNDSFENKINCKIRHMVNDLLRENISIYWLAEDITINVKNIINGEINVEQNEMFFKKGSFIIPFTGKDLKDDKICLIIFDYNESSEIGKENQFKVPIYIINNELEVNSYLLTKVKIAQYVNYMISLEQDYLRIAGDCGFFNFDNIADEAIDKNLKKSNYNVVIWPGGTPFPFIPTVIDILQEELKRNSTTSAIRRFVNNGGGYIGSCYGAYVASYCMLPLPAYYIRQVYNPDLRTFGIAAISDVVTRMTRFTLYEEETIIHLINDSHPLTYGLDPLILCVFYHGGPKIIKVGKNSEVIGKYQESSLMLKDSPTWVSSMFGKGRVVIFSTHPEYYVYDLERNDLKNDTISNALFYTTYKEKLIFKTIKFRDLTYVNNNWQKTKNLENYLEKTFDIFNNIRIEINKSKEFLSLFFGKYVYNLVSYIYLNESLKSLTKIEKIYYLFEYDLDFKKNLTNFKEEIVSKAIYTSSELKKFKEKYFFIYEKIKPPFLIFKSIIFNTLINYLVPFFRVCLRNIPQIYFNSEKFLRHYWYEFEANIANQ